MHKKGRMAFVSMCLQHIYDCFGPNANRKEDKFYLKQNSNTYEILMTITGMERWYWKAVKEEGRLSKDCGLAFKHQFENHDTHVIRPCLCVVLPACKVEIMILTSSARYFALKTVLGIISYKSPWNELLYIDKSINAIFWAFLTKKDWFSTLEEEYFIDPKDVWGWTLELWTCFRFCLTSAAKEFHSLQWTRERDGFCFLSPAENLCGQIPRARDNSKLCLCSGSTCLTLFNSSHAQRQGTIKTEGQGTIKTEMLWVYVLFL